MEDKTQCGAEIVPSVDDLLGKEVQTCITGVVNDCFFTCFQMCPLVEVFSALLKKCDQ